MNHKLNKKKGFTLAELLLSLALFGAIVGLSAPLTQSFLFQREVESATNMIVSASRTAQNKSISNENESRWGVYIEQDQVTIFAGDTYTTRDTAEDITLLYEGTVTITGLGEVVFTQIDGFPQTTGTLQVTRNQIDNTIEFNEKGAIFY